MIRKLKTIFIILVGLQGLFYFISNALNFAAAKGAVGLVLGQIENTVYTNPVIPPITSPALITLALVIIMTGELLIGLVAFRGALDMWKARNASAAEFNAAKTYGILGCGLAVLIWFGIFIVFGAALFQMWQGPVGDGSFDGAFIYMATSALVMIFVNQPDS